MNYQKLFIPSDIDILILVKQFPELLIENYYIKKRYHKITKLLNFYTATYNNVFINNKTIS